ncbi:MAG: c-type cytochrome [Cellvibrionaceae bacterium]
MLALGTDNARDHTGKMEFDQYCSACHGRDGSGNEILGAPNLRNDIWLYGGSADAVKTSIVRGRRGVMPAFGERLDDTQIKLLVAWLTRDHADKSSEPAPSRDVD